MITPITDGRLLAPLITVLGVLSTCTIKITQFALGQFARHPVYSTVVLTPVTTFLYHQFKQSSSLNEFIINTGNALINGGAVVAHAGVKAVQVSARAGMCLAEEGPQVNLKFAACALGTPEKTIENTAKIFLLSTTATILLGSAFVIYLRGGSRDDGS